MVHSPCLLSSPEAITAVCLFYTHSVNIFYNYICIHITIHYYFMRIAVDSKGRGLMYQSYVDCMTKTFRQEGVKGLYKGVIPCYLRLGPHVVLSMVFWERLQLLEKKMSAYIKNPNSL